MTTIFTLPKQVPLSSTGGLLAGAKLYFYITNTTTPKNTYTDFALTTPATNPLVADANGVFAKTYLSEDERYRISLKTSADVLIYTEDDIGGPALTQQEWGQIGFPRTAAEIAASVTPTYYFYSPGDLRRYGGIADGTTDNATALSNACLQAAQTGGAPVYVCGNSTGFKVSTGVSLTGPILIQGDILGTSRIFTAADITILTIPYVASGSVISDIKFNGPGTGSSTKSVIELNNANGNVFRRIYASAGKYGIYFNKGINSCYLNALHDCQIISNGTTNIHCEGNTNALYLSNCTIGGGPCAKGLYMVDSNNLSVIGGDAEGLTTCVFDLDATSTLQSAHYISGFHFEGNTSSGGDVRIGNTAAVNGIALVGNLYAPGTGNDSAVNAIRGDGLAILGGNLHSGYTGVSFTRIGASFGRYSVLGVGNWDNVTNELTMAGGFYTKRVVVTYSTSMTPDAATGNVFEIIITNGTAFAVNAPTNSVDGQRISLWVANSSGGAHGTGTMNAAFKLAGGGSTLPAIATGNNRTFAFEYRSAASAWYEVSRNASDVPN